jgi:hypothetical protein
LRNNLGVKNLNDWIFKLNLVNVTHLNPLETDSLSSEEAKDGIELSKDAMLEKVVLIVSSFYCMALQAMKIKSDWREAETFCAKSVEIALSFLPE